MQTVYKKMNYEYNAWVLRVVDGDTVDLRVDLGFGVTMPVRTQIAGIKAPKRGDFKYAEAGDALYEFFNVHNNVFDNELPYVHVRSYKSGTSKDSWGRWVADINLLADPSTPDVVIPVNAGLFLLATGLVEAKGL